MSIYKGRHECSFSQFYFRSVRIFTRTFIAHINNPSRIFYKILIDIILCIYRQDVSVIYLHISLYFFVFLFPLPRNLIPALCLLCGMSSLFFFPPAAFHPAYKNLFCQFCHYCQFPDFISLRALQTDKTVNTDISFFCMRFLRLLRYFSLICSFCGSYNYLNCLNCLMSFFRTLCSKRDR